MHERQLTTSGWDRLYNSDFLTQTLLPHSLALTLSLYRLSTAAFRKGFLPQRADNISGYSFRIGNRTGLVTPASHTSPCSSAGRGCRCSWRQCRTVATRWPCSSLASAPPIGATIASSFLLVGPSGQLHGAGRPDARPTLRPV
jgi:hypothetical protein